MRDMIEAIVRRGIHATHLIHHVSLKLNVTNLRGPQDILICICIFMVLSISAFCPV
jgi:hypothetical protein